MSSLEEENKNAIWMIYYSFYLWVKKMQLCSENEKAFLLIHFNLNYGTDSLPHLGCRNKQMFDIFARKMAKKIICLPK